MNFALSIIVSYFIGCIPFSLIVSKLIAGKNPGTAGSKSFGALNSYEITGRWQVGVLVLLLDALKGVLAVFLTYNFIFPKSIYIILSTLAVVCGHCYNVFLRFKGGRGLATALGCCLMFNPFIAVIWGIVWLIFRIVSKDILFQNMWASLITPVIVYIAPSYLFFIANYNYYVSLYDYKIFAILLCVIILSAHLRSMAMFSKKQ